jgi:hypothetical protein
MTTKNDTSPQTLKRLVLNRERVRNLGTQTGLRTGAYVPSSWGGNSAPGSVGVNTGSRPPIDTTGSLLTGESGGIVIGG